MTGFDGIRFFGTPWTVGISCALVAATAAVSLWSWRRSGWSAGHGLLELVRLAIAGLVALLLNQPEWVEERRSDEKPAIVVLHDASRSMDTRDVRPAEAGATAALRTRRQAAEPLTAAGFWDPLRERFEVEMVAVSPTTSGTTAPDASGTASLSSGAGAGTNLAAPLEDVAQAAGVRAVVLVSDGDWTEGGSPLEAAQKLRLAQVPVFTVAVGSRTRLPDLELASLDCPTVGVTGKPVRVPFTIQSSLPTERTASVRLAVSSGETLAKDVRLPAMGTVTDWFFWTPRETGDYTITVTVPPEEGEVLSDNNARTAPIAVRTEKLRVLVVEGVPR